MQKLLDLERSLISLYIQSTTNDTIAGLDQERALSTRQAAEFLNVYRVISL